MGLEPAVFEARIWMLKTPATSGMPLITPVAGTDFMPFGKPLMAKVFG